MTQSQGTTKTAGPDSILFHEACTQVRPEMRALGPGELAAVNLDIPSAVAMVLGSLPEIRALRPRIQKELPAFDLVQFDKLETYTMAVSFTNTLFLMATQPVDSLEQLMKDGIALRETLLSDASALAHRGVLNSASLKDLKGINGYKNVAVDLQLLAALFRDGWTRIGGKCVTEQSELLQAEQIAAGILRAVGFREQGPASTSAAADDRVRAFTLFRNAYDQTRRAVLYLRWNEDDANSIAPSLYSGHGGHAKAAPPPHPPVPPVGGAPGTPPGGTGTTSGKPGNEPPLVPGAGKPIAPGMPGADPFLR